MKDYMSIIRREISKLFYRLQGNEEMVFVLSSRELSDSLLEAMDTPYEDCSSELE